MRTLALALLLIGSRVSAAEPNGLMLNGGPVQEIIRGPLTAAGLSEVPGLVDAIAHDVGARQFFKYLTGCALREDQTLVVPTEPEPTTFEGAFGLAAEWADGPCDEGCQEWVSACLAARTNTFGIPVIIHARGLHPSLLDDPVEERARFPVEEGAFYGNYFADPPRQYACRGDGEDALSRTVRICTEPGNACGIQVVGGCDDACDGLDEAAGGAYTACHNRARTGGGDPPEPSRRYERVITIYLKRTSFQPADDALPCEAAPPPEPRPEPPRPRPGPKAGEPCVNDDDCDDAILACDARAPGGMCTVACTPSLDRQEEADQCGGDGTTCLSSIAGPYCTRTCRPGTGECGPARICTGWFFVQNGGVPDQAGCFPFCRGDDDCPPTAFCNPRLGQCGAPFDPTALPDGEPCEFPAPGRVTPVVPCRGSCLRVDPDPTHGLCASAIDLAVDDTCPDDPEHIRPQRRPGDDLGMCLFKSCVTSNDCTPPLECRGNPRLGQPLQCAFPPPG